MAAWAGAAAKPMRAATAVAGASTNLLRVRVRHAAGLRRLGRGFHGDGTTVTVPDLTGGTAAAFRVVRDGETLTVTCEGMDRPYRVVAEATGATAEEAGTVTLRGV